MLNMFKSSTIINKNISLIIVSIVVFILFIYSAGYVLGEFLYNISH